MPHLDVKEIDNTIRYLEVRVRPALMDQANAPVPPLQFGDLQTYPRPSPAHQAGEAGQADLHAALDSAVACLSFLRKAAEMGQDVPEGLLVPVRPYLDACRNDSAAQDDNEAKPKKKKTKH
jgi:hypothetical protein